MFLTIIIPKKYVNINARIYKDIKQEASKSNQSKYHTQANYQHQDNNHERVIWNKQVEQNTHLTAPVHFQSPRRTTLVIFRLRSHALWITRTAISWRLIGHAARGRSFRPCDNGGRASGYGNWHGDGGVSTVAAPSGLLVRGLGNERKF